MAMLALVTASCSDFLEILPLNDVVLENYWTKKDDVTSVLNSCYESLESTNSLTRMGIWGEMRSDNLVQGGSINNDYAEILKENILPTNSMSDWAVMYTTINRCNTVIHYAPSVCEKDPNYTYDELQANIAEATFIRDLSYFYLIRAFRDVPISFEPSIDDTRDYKIPATPMYHAIDTLIADLEKVKDLAVRRYIDDSRMTNREASDKAYENSSRVTRVAIYALLADLYLWAGKYEKAEECCDFVINFKQQQYKERVDALGELTDMKEFAGIPLILERPEGTLLYGNAYTEIFGTGNSFESLFELSFGTGQSTTNSYVADFYGSGSTPLGRFSAPEQHCKNAVSDKNDLYRLNDCRVYEFMSEQNSKYAISKYCFSDISLDVSKVTDEKSLKLQPSRRGQNYANWIVYRLTDVMLMKAEACIFKQSADYETAFNMINAVNKRARNIVTTADKDTLVYANYNTSREKMEQLLLDERNRELMFEGKRWFDLVRTSLRDGNTKHLVNEATIKYQDNVNAIKIKLADPNIIFWPYNKEELKKNPMLKQNSAYSDTEDFKS